MDKPVYPCRSCAQEWRSNCKNCPEWRLWYFYRQHLINAYAQQLKEKYPTPPPTEADREPGRFWRYELPLHPVKKKG